MRRGGESGRLHQLDEARQVPESDGFRRSEALLDLVDRQVGRQLEPLMETGGFARARQPGIEQQPAAGLELRLAGIDAVDEAVLLRVDVGRTEWRGNGGQY